MLENQILQMKAKYLKSHYGNVSFSEEGLPFSTVACVQCGLTVNTFHPMPSGLCSLCFEGRGYELSEEQMNYWNQKAELLEVPKER